MLPLFYQHSLEHLVVVACRSDLACDSLHSKHFTTHYAFSEHQLLNACTSKKMMKARNAITASARKMILKKIAPQVCPAPILTLSQKLGLRLRRLLIISFELLL